MRVGKVIGTLWATRKDERLSGMKLLCVLPLNICTGVNSDEPLIAVDSVGAGVGDTVLLVGGSSARSATGDSNAPVDATIVGIVDAHEIQ